MRFLFFIILVVETAFASSFLESSDGKLFGRKLFLNLDDDKTFFCNCSFNKKGIRLFQQNCSVVLKSKNPIVKMGNIVPVSLYAKNFKEYYKGNVKCFSEGKKFFGTKCVQLVNENYKELERDLNNIYPIEDNILERIGNLKPDLLNEKDKLNKRLDSCPIILNQKNFMPLDDSKKGWIARIYLYLDDEYPEAKIINAEELKLYKEWDKNYPPSEKECNYINKNNHLQERQNKTIKNRCKEK